MCVLQELPSNEAVNPDSSSLSTITSDVQSLAAKPKGNRPNSVSSLTSDDLKAIVDSKADPIQITGDLLSPQPRNDVLEFSSEESGFSLFRNLHDVVCKRWQVECDKWNGISAELESQVFSEEGTNGSHKNVERRGTAL